MNNKKIYGNSKTREDHKLIVLNFIRKHGQVSRTDIYEKTRISKPTVTRVIEELLKEGIVRETGVGESSIGRKPVYIELNPSAYYCMGVNISRNTIRASMVDLGMNIISKKAVDIRHINSVEIFKETVAAAVKDLCSESKVEPENILGVGIGASGIIDSKKGVILDFAIGHKLLDIHLKKYLEEALAMKVLIDNIANTRTLGEYWYGYGVGYKNIIFVSCSEGIGSGIIVEGNILRGKSNVTGEIGHMIVNTNGRKCICGRYGCIEAYSSTEAVENLTREVLRQGRSSILLNRVNEDIEIINYKMICECADQEDQLCIERLEEAASILSTGLANTIGIINPELVILSGDMFDASDYFYEMVKRFTKEKLFNVLTQDVVFKKRKVQDSLYEIGAAALVFKSVFRD